MTSKLSDNAATSPICTICQSANSTPQVAPPSTPFLFSIACIWLFCRLSATVCEVAVRIGNMLVHVCDMICCGSGSCPHDWVLGCNFRFLSLPLLVIRDVEVKRIIPRAHFGFCSTSTVSYSADNDLQFLNWFLFKHFEIFLSVICCGKQFSILCQLKGEDCILSSTYVYVETWLKWDLPST